MDCCCLYSGDCNDADFYYVKKCENKRDEGTDIIQRLKKVLKLTFIALILGSIYLYIFTTYGIGIPCVFYKVTGWQCPGCGMTRAIAQLWKGNIEQAISYNVLSVSIFPIFVIYLIYRIVVYIKGADSSFKIWEYVVLILLWIATIGYGIARNVI